MRNKIFKYTIIREEVNSMHTFGEKVRILRELNQMNQQELAFKVRVGPGTIKKYETGYLIPDTQTLLKLSTVLDVPATELISYSNQITSQIDEELIELINQLGVSTTKTILLKLKDIPVDELFTLLEWINRSKLPLQ
ncbi:helix-turn-helix domain-containing protein [Litchfieldia alkalitelluris]|uniref:helix-turn-helix domain-containing protein n=1 Tax=Litchfieldia alkalitelluris TaxID=304268 RepID=UPI001F286386|nr:helix-turn-helix transcriptional regulator [Litchfieldia alkalitelluris]